MPATHRFFRFFAERPTLAMVITIMIIILGAGTLLTIQRDVFPKVEFGEVIITTVYPGASPEDVELNVTNELEEELKSVAGIDTYTSYSMENFSFIDVTVDPDVSDQDEKIREIREAVNRVTDLPPEVDELPSVLEISTSVFPVIEIGLTGDVPYDELREFAKGLEKKLERLSGVASIDKFGYREREVRVEVDPRKMRDYQLSLRSITNAIRARNIRSTGGSFESYTSDKNVVTLAQFANPDEVGEVIVRSSFDGPVIRVGDLATVSDTYEDLDVTTKMNGKPGISFIVYKKESADAIRTVDAIFATVDAELDRMPEGLEVAYANDFSRYLRNRMKVVASNGLIGLVLVVLLLGVFLDVRSAFWVAMGIPITMLGTIFLLPMFDYTLDVIGLAAMIMVVGIVVDDAIIIAENIHTKREQGLPPIDAAAAGIGEVFKPVLTTILTTFVAFAPMFFMSGIMGKFVFIIPLTITCALLVSLLESTIALPAHVVHGVKQRENRQKEARSWFNPVRSFYRMSIYWVFKARYLVIAISIAMFLGGLWFATNKMGFVLFPTSAADAFYVQVETPRGSSLDFTSEKLREIEALIDDLPEEEVDSYITRVGNQADFQPGQADNWALIGCYLSPNSERSRVAEEIVESLRAKTDQLDGFDRIIYSIDAGGPPVGRPITFRVVGSDDDRRTQLADSVVAYMATLTGVKDIDRNDKAGKDQVEIDIDYAQLSRLGLTVADIADNVRTAYDGDVVTSVRYGDEDVEFRVMLNKQARTDPQYLARLEVPNNQGRLIRLGQVAKFTIGPGPSSWYHYDGDRSVLITGDVESGVTTPLAATQQVQSHFDMGDWDGLRFVVGGEAEETAESMHSLFGAFISAVVGIYLLLVLLFNSVAQPLMVLAAIPLGIVGVIIAFVLHDEPLGFLAMLGVVGLSGVVVNDSLVLVNHINKLRRERPGDRMLEVVTDASADRLRAVVLTTLTTVAGLLPLAYGVGGSDPFIAPMALSMGFGLMFASPITLALVPSLYLVVDDIKKVFRWIGRKLSSRSSSRVDSRRATNH